jgi:hypothetical protein
MMSYLYPTHPCDSLGGNWVENIRDEWKQNCKPYFSLWFLRVTPQQLISRERGGYPFWLYMYYSDKKIKELCPEKYLQAMQVQYRIRVIDFCTKPTNPYNDNSTYNVDPGEPPNIWFKCDRFEEIRKISNSGCQFLSFHDFEHVDANTDLSSALQATIPPVRVIAPFVVVQTNWYEIPA